MKIIHNYLFIILYLFSAKIKSQDKIFFEESFIPISKNTFICKFEVTNKQYNTYLSEEGQNNINKINNQGWQEGEEFSFSFFAADAEFYHLNYKYENHPVVNIYQDAADLYCLWLNEKYNQDTTVFGNRVNFRLPTKKEWRMISSKFKDISVKNERLGFNPLPNNEKIDRFNITPETVNENNFNPESDIFSFLMSDEYIALFTTWPVNYYHNKEPKLMHLYGNVSEWISEKNIAIGGNWMTKNKDEVDDTLLLRNYSPKVGFRVVMEIIE